MYKNRIFQFYFSVWLMCSLSLQFLLKSVSSVPIPTFQLGYHLFSDLPNCNVLETKMLRPGYLCVCIHTPPRNIFELLPHPHFPMLPSTHTSWSCIVLANIPNNNENQTPRPQPQQSQIPTVPSVTLGNISQQFQIPAIPGGNSIPIYIVDKKPSPSTTMKTVPDSSSKPGGNDEVEETEQPKPSNTSSTSTTTTTTTPSTSTTASTPSTSTITSTPSTSTTTSTTSTTTAKSMPNIISEALAAVVAPVVFDDVTTIKATTTTIKTPKYPSPTTEPSESEPEAE